MLTRKYGLGEVIEAWTVDDLPPGSGWRLAEPWSCLPREDYDDYHDPEPAYLYESIEGAVVACWDVYPDLYFGKGV